MTLMSMVKQTGDKITSAINFLDQEGVSYVGLTDTEIYKVALGVQRTNLTGELWF